MGLGSWSNYSELSFNFDFDIIFCFKPELLSYLSGERNLSDFFIGYFLFKILDFLSIIFIIINNNY